MISHLLTYGNSIRSTQTVAFVNNMLKTGFNIPAHKLPFYAHTKQLITKSTYTRPICISSGFSENYIPDQKYSPQIRRCRILQPFKYYKTKDKMKIFYIKQQSIYVRKKDWIPDRIDTSLKRISEL